MPIRIGVISDTHGSVAPEVTNLFKGVKIIIHAGDAENRFGLANLESLADVVAVRGNTDRNDLLPELKTTEIIEINDIAIYAIHDISQMDFNAETAGIGIVIHGHTHRPSIEYRGNVLYLNPGSASSPRVPEGASVGIIEIENGKIEAQILYFESK